MSGAVRKFKASGADQDTTILEFISRVMSLTATDAKRRIKEGGVYLDRERVQDPNRKLAPGVRLAVYPGRSMKLPELKRVYLDEEVIVIDKPAGLPSQATRSNTALAADAIVRKTFPDARLFHRLDRDVTGLLLFTRTPEAAQVFTNRMKRGAFIRRYRARVSGHIAGDSGVFDQPIGRDPVDPTRQAAGNGLPALTHYRVLARTLCAGQPITELELTLETGRTHQIRVHLAHAGHPVLGDARYGTPGPSLVLAAWELEWTGRHLTSPLAMATFRDAPRHFTS